MTRGLSHWQRNTFFFFFLYETWKIDKPSGDFVEKEEKRWSMETCEFLKEKMK